MTHTLRNEFNLKTYANWEDNYASQSRKTAIAHHSGESSKT